MVNHSNKDRVIMNKRCGYLMRTKVSSSNEGGVATGFAVLDSVYLTDEVKIHSRNTFIIFL
jgi:glutathione synthase